MATLVVSDDGVVRDLAVVILKRCGFQVRSAAGGNEAMWELNASSFDSIVIDARRQAVECRTFLNSISARPNLPRLVLMVDERNPLQFPECGRLPETIFLSKPFEDDAIAEAVRGNTLPSTRIS